MLDREPAAEVAVLEAEFCGAGPSGRNGGFIEGYWPALGELVELFGADDAVRLAEAGEGIRPAVRALGDDVWLRESGMLMVATTAAQERVLDRAIAAAAAVDRPDQAVAVSREEVARRCRSPRFRRGVLFPDTGTVHPARLVRSLRRAALARGVRLYEQTPARSSGPSLLLTPRGRVRATQVVVATNAAMTDWHPVRGRLTVVRQLRRPHRTDSRAPGARSAGRAVRRSSMPGCSCTTSRTTDDGRVLMGSGSGPIGFGNRIDRRFTHDAPTATRAELGLRRLLPGLAAAAVERSWGGPIDVSADHIPFVGTTAGRVHFAAGFSGNGVGPAYLAGQSLASLATGRDDEWSTLPLVRGRGRGVPREPFRHLGGATIRRAILACEEADEAGREAPSVARAVAAVPRLLGMRLGMR